MRLKLFYLAAFTLILGIGCSNAAKSTINEKNTAVKPAVESQVAEDSAPRITLEEAKKDFDAGNTVFIDTRAAEVYKEEHIKGAINITVSQIAERFAEIPTDKKIIAYCS